MKAKILMFVAALWCGAVQAQIPHKINYQGYLTDPGGTPVNATLPMVFKLYNVVSGGVALYSEPQSVTVTNGLYDVLIGSVTPLSLPFDAQYYLGVTVNADPEMTPRQPLAASPYALRAAAAESLAPGATVAGSQVTGTVGSATSFSGPLAGDVTGTQSATSIAATTVTGKTLTGFASGPGAITAGDSILTAIDKLDGNLALKAPLASPTFTGFVGIGTSTPTTAFTGFAMKNNVNTFYGAYVDAGASGTPFWGYALNGVAKSYLAFSGPNSALEYHQTSDATPDFFINGNTKAVFNTGFVGIGTSAPTTAFTGFAMKSAANSFYGSYIDAGATGIPFYGYALNGVAKSYWAFNGPNNAMEYHQTSDSTPDFFINGNTKAVFNTGFVGIGTSAPTTAFTGLAIKKNVNNFFGTYVDAGTTGIPFYGYALNGTAVAYTTYNGSTNQFEYHHTTDANPDFAISNTKVTFPIQTFLGLGTDTATNSSTGLTMKNNVNAYYGMYIDAGAAGEPFYGYALNGVPAAWTELNGTNGNWELFYGGVRLAVASNGNVGIGTSPGTQKLDVGGTIHALNLNGGATTLSTDASGNIIRTPSDANLKRDVSEIKDALAKVLRLRGVTYQFKDTKRFGGSRQMGFLAQDLEGLVPEAVSAGGEYRSVNYPVLTALLAEAIKGQQRQIDRQARENRELKKLVKDLIRKVDVHSR